MLLAFVLSPALAALCVRKAGWLQAEVNQTISSPIAGSVFSTDGKIMVLSVINFQPIGVEAEALLYFDIENPGVIGGAGAADGRVGPVGRLKAKGVGDD